MFFESKGGRFEKNIILRLPDNSFIRDTVCITIYWFYKCLIKIRHENISDKSDIIYHNIDTI